MVFDESTDLVGILRRIAAFFRDESCGQCVPCRVGHRAPGGAARTRSPRGSRTAPSADGAGAPREIGQAMRDASICGLGQTASSPIESAPSRGRSSLLTMTHESADQPDPVGPPSRCRTLPGRRRPGAQSS